VFIVVVEKSLVILGYKRDCRYSDLQLAFMLLEQPLMVDSVLQVKTFKELYRKVINDKHEDVMAKLGAIISQGIIDAGAAETHEQWCSIANNVFPNFHFKTKRPRNSW